MRYYQLDLTNTSGAPLYLPSIGSVFGHTLTSLQPDGVTTNPAALNVEIDVQTTINDAPVSASGVHLRIWGVSLKDISQAFTLYGANASLRVGMAKGLPLANPAQQGTIFKGWVYQAFGNWIGLDLTIDLILLPGTAPLGAGSPLTPVNINFVWQAGQPLSQALQTCLSQAYPGVTLSINVSSSLVRTDTVTHKTQSLSELGSWLKSLTLGMNLGPTYLGVSIVYDDRGIVVFDGTGVSNSTAKMINFQDLIGQPTWIQAPLIQFKTVMRGDIKAGTLVQLPPSPTIATPQAVVNLRDNLTFTGPFLVLYEYHFGNYRQPDAESWATVFEATPLNAPPPTTSGPYTALQ